MLLRILEGVLIPFLGTTLGALCVFFLKNGVGAKTTKALNGFAGGVMVAASVWSLLIPAIDESAHLGALSFVPAVVGFFLGIFFLFLLDKVIPHTHLNEQSEGPRSRLGKNTMLFFAVTLHNIPEGVAIGVVFASFLTGGGEISLAEAFALSIGDADNIDRFDAYRIFENLKWAKYDEMSIEEKTGHVAKVLERLESYKNLDFATETGKNMWLEKLEYQIGFYKKLQMQIENSRLG